MAYPDGLRKGGRYAILVGVFLLGRAARRRLHSEPLALALITGGVIASVLGRNHTETMDRFIGLAEHVDYRLDEVEEVITEQVQQVNEHVQDSKRASRDAGRAAAEFGRQIGKGEVRREVRDNRTIQTMEHGMNSPDGGSSDHEI